MIRSRSSKLAKGLTVTVAATGSLAATWGAVPAAAQTFSFLGKPATDPFNAWSFGVGGGYRLFQTPVTINSEDGYSNTGAGTFANFEVGRDWHVGDRVFGFGANLTLGNTPATFSDVSSESEAYADHKEWQESFSLTGRFGHAVGNQALIYGLLGWTWQHYSASIGGNSAIPDQVSERGFVNGPTVGFGLEAALPGRPNITLKSEYRWTQLGELGPLSSDGYSYAFGKTDVHAVMFTLSFKTAAGPGFP